MARTRFPYRRPSDRGQSLIETALLLPILLLLAFNAINFGYFFFVAVNLTAAPRSGVQYSILGFSTPESLAIPPAGPSGASCPTAITDPSPYVCTLTFQDMAGVLHSYAAATVRVCNSKLGTSGTGSGKVANCATYGSGTVTGGPAADPEAPLFVLSRVDVVYNLTPIIPAFQLPTPAGPISLTLIPSLTMRRQVSMREMN
jgi:hypothetical protein